jgi:hypothetical protein
MKFNIQHLLTYLETGPCIGMQMKAFRRDRYNLLAAVIIPIPQWVSNLLKRIKG